MAMSLSHSSTSKYSALKKYVQSHQTDVTNKYWRHPLLSYTHQTWIHRAIRLILVGRFCLFHSICRCFCFCFLLLMWWLLFCCCRCYCLFSLSCFISKIRCINRIDGTISWLRCVCLAFFNITFIYFLLVLCVYILLDSPMEPFFCTYSLRFVYDERTQLNIPIERHSRCFFLFVQ